LNKETKTPKRKAFFKALFKAFFKAFAKRCKIHQKERPFLRHSYPGFKAV